MMEQQTPERFASPPRPQFPERRRPQWREFRRAYPGILATMGFSLCLLVAMDVWLVKKRERYVEEDARLRESMSGLQRQQADAILSNEQNKVRMMIELVKRQAQVDKQLHLAVPVDSGVMYLEQDGALLREMPVQVGPERRVGMPPDTVFMAAPRGTRTVERILSVDDAWEVPAWVYTDRGVAVPTDRTLKGALGPAAVVLVGGTVIYSMPSVGPLNDSSYVLPGGVRTRAADLQAIAANLKAGMTVYFY
ncbi:MAG TPA: hypothetical protein VGJ18_00610 [Gemmatimonadaceae bacterium]